MQKNLLLAAGAFLATSLVNAGGNSVAPTAPKEDIVMKIIKRNDPHFLPHALPLVYSGDKAQKARYVAAAQELVEHKRAEAAIRFKVKRLFGPEGVAAFISAIGAAGFAMGAYHATQDSAKEKERWVTASFWGGFIGSVSNLMLRVNDVYKNVTTVNHKHDEALKKATEVLDYLEAIPTRSAAVGA